MDLLAFAKCVKKISDISPTYMEQDGGVAFVLLLILPLTLSILFNLCLASDPHHQNLFDAEDEGSHAVEPLNQMTMSLKSCYH